MLVSHPARPAQHLLRAEASTIKRMVGDNAIDIFGLDRLEPRRWRIRSPPRLSEQTGDRINRALVSVGASDHAFRLGQTGWS